MSTKAKPKVRTARPHWPTEITEHTAKLWLDNGTVSVDNVGNENTYYIDQFDNRFYCKNYPVIN